MEFVQTYPAKPAECLFALSITSSKLLNVVIGDSGPNGSTVIILKLSFTNLAELCYQIKILAPHLVLLQETCLKNSIEDICMPGYRTISRRDRAEGENRGGVIAFARLDTYNIVDVKNSDNVERT